MKRVRPTVKVEDASDSSDADDDGSKEVIVDFELFNPSDIDFLSVKNYCRALLANISADLSLAPQITDSILKGDVGSVVKCEGYTDALAVISALPLWGEKTEAWAAPFLESAGIAKKDAAGVGLLVNLRIINMPVMKLAPAMHNCLFDEVAKVRKGADKYTRYVLVAPFYYNNELDEEEKEAEEDDDEDEEKKKDEEKKDEDSARKRKMKKAAKKKAKVEETVMAAAAEAQAALDAEKVYVRAEEELYVEAADKVKEVKPSPLSASADAHSLLVPKHTLVAVIDASKVPSILKKMKTEFSN